MSDSPKDKKSGNIVRQVQAAHPFKLGPLEQRLISIIFERGSATVREILDHGEFSQAYTTVMTTLSRLCRKGLLVRTSEGRAFRYTPLRSQAELEREVAAANIQQLLALNSSAAVPLSYLIDTICEVDTDLLDELHRLVDKKRSELKHNAKPTT
jgi:predicted transcriptional regulator